MNLFVFPYFPARSSLPALGFVCQDQQVPPCDSCFQGSRNSTLVLCADAICFSTKSNMLAFFAAVAESSPVKEIILRIVSVGVHYIECTGVGFKIIIPCRANQVRPAQESGYSSNCSLHLSLYNCQTKPGSAFSVVPQQTAAIV